MKKIAYFAALFVLILLLTKIANQAPSEQQSGVAFSLKAQSVVQCSTTEITLIDRREQATHLVKDNSWPACTAFQPNDVFDFYLSRGEMTHFISMERSSWWRKTM